MMDDTYHFGEAFERPVATGRRFGIPRVHIARTRDGGAGPLSDGRGAAPLVRSAWYRPVNVRL